MEIQKIFSSYDDYGYEEDRIYSVLMDEDELVLFSEIQKEFGAEAMIAKAAKKTLREKGREAMAKQMLKGAPQYSRDAILSSRGNIRRLTNPSAMGNGTYVKDMGLDRLGALNTRITNRGRNLSSSWSGVHGTTLGNAKAKRR